MFHVEIRQFPHNAWRFNLNEQEVQAIVLPWAHERIIEFGERKWSPERARLTVLEGPKLELQQLSMGRGWRTAQREGRDVTTRMIQWARETGVAAERRPSAPASPAAASTSGEERSEAAVLLAPLLGDDAVALLDAWRAAAGAAATTLKPSESLAIAEEVIARRQGA